MRKALYFLGILDDSDLDWMIRHGKKMSLAPGTVLIEQGKSTEWLYWILQGRFEVYTNVAPHIALLQVGDVVGEISFVDSRPPTASVRAECESKVGAIPRDLLADKIRSDVGFASRFYQSIAAFLADRLRAEVAKGGSRRLKLEESIEDEDELASHLLSNVSMAGTRLAEMQKRAWGS
jgi:CRP/FNR family cyclic AMP-dependent transcriptional regulator